MITEEQVREAVARIVYYCDDIGRQSQARGYDADIDMTTLAEWARQELARRESERAERAKPIDGEWCLANGAERSNHSGECRWVFGSVNVYWQAGYGVSLEGDPYERIYVREITTRGQLLDLLAALKGGAT